MKAILKHHQLIFSLKKKNNLKNQHEKLGPNKFEQKKNLKKKVIKVCNNLTFPQEGMHQGTLKTPLNLIKSQILLNLKQREFTLYSQKIEFSS